MALAARLPWAAIAIALTVGRAAAQAAGTGEGPAVIGGRVVDHETGVGVSGATVTLSMSVAGVRPQVRTSGTEGRFEFLDVPAGGYTLRIESLGYQPIVQALDVSASSDVRLEVRVSASPLDLEPIVVVSPRRPAFMNGFDERRALGRTHTAFFTAAEIADRDPHLLTDLFVAVPGAYVEPGVLSNTMRLAGTPAGSAFRGCSPDVWVNGVLNTGVPVDEMFRPDQVEAVELYTLQHDVPARFEGPRRCGALVIWLRDRGADERPWRPGWQRWLLVLGALGATILMTR
jgi:hypothetical protein